MGWIFAAYGVVWIAFFAYAFSLDKRQRSLSSEIADLKKKLGG